MKKNYTQLKDDLHFPERLEDIPTNPLKETIINSRSKPIFYYHFIAVQIYLEKILYAPFTELVSLMADQVGSTPSMILLKVCT